jgi:mono/diheme cytochrome c family protein
MGLIAFWTTAWADMGPDLPPAGRSRFDILIGDAPVPYPLPRLMARIRSQLEAPGDGLSPLKLTLIPLGRSLQRAASAPDFFMFPRVVAAVDGASKAGYAPLQDRLFFGYNERAGVLEVISYNEPAGRFEFQVVHDYRAGAQPQIHYARRTLCLACHQNAAPIFARPLWDETPANPAIAARLKATGRDFYGIPISGTDIAYFVDAAAERANLFPVMQQVWREACDASCRAQWLSAALAYALSGSLSDDAALALPGLAARWKKVWPQGLPIPSSSIPNRDPLANGVESKAGTAVARAAALAKLAPVPARFEPLNPRPPLQSWSAPDPAQLVAGLAGLLNRSDVQALDRTLATNGAAPSQLHPLPCRVTHKPGRVVFDCAAGGMRLSGIVRQAGNKLSGQIGRLQAGPDKTASDLTLSGRVSQSGHIELTPRRGTGSVRLSDGRRWASLRFASLRAGQGKAELILVDDYARARAALPRLSSLTAQVFDGSRALAELQAALGHPRRVAATARLPAARLEPAESDSSTARHLSGAAARFLQHCGQCHDSTSNVPPNFLHGDAVEVNARLDHCAERIFYRLSMWRVADAQRGKTPMPPLFVLTSRGLDAPGWTRSPQLAALLDDARQRIRAQGGQPERLLAQPFEQLRTCLPASSP